VVLRSLQAPGSVSDDILPKGANSLGQNEWIETRTSREVHKVRSVCVSAKGPGYMPKRVGGGNENQRGGTARGRYHGDHGQVSRFVDPYQKALPIQRVKGSLPLSVGGLPAERLGEVRPPGISVFQADSCGTLAIGGPDRDLDDPAQGQFQGHALALGENNHGAPFLP
jgi:hypothetical protein